jgi:hypothetical protein
MMSAPVIFLYRTKISAGRYAPAMWPKCIGPFAYGNALVTMIFSFANSEELISMLPRRFCGLDNTSIPDAKIQNRIAPEPICAHSVPLRLI